ncbi:hypothetical protein [Bacillus sp. 3255]|uniref:hypothetical protein n=1 Tax=Bacillus sp. 3255 TaxID=2817904 RepID=UPI00285CA833|nr:hypothetical protein [Bacillus sp. 3255]MDR6879117.1 putative repeat protein (TIGR01451 family) [Bacillus sp. 3255]
MTAISPPIFGCPASSRKGDSPLTSSLYVGSLPAKSRLTVTFQVTVNSSADQGQLTERVAVLFTFKLPDDQTVSDSVLTNAVSTQLLQPVPAIGITATPTVTEPESPVHFRIRVSNAGNLSADSVTVQNWISPLTTLLPGTLRIGDVPVNLTAPVTQPLVLWAVPLNGSTEITYTEAVVSRPNTRRIPLRSAAQYAYQVNDPVHTGTVLSNEAMIWVEQADE